MAGGGAQPVGNANVRGSAGQEGRVGGDAEAPADLGEGHVTGLAAGLAGEPLLGCGGVLGVLEGLPGGRGFEGAQAEELGERHDDGHMAAEVDHLVRVRHGLHGGRNRTNGLGGHRVLSLRLPSQPIVAVTQGRGRAARRCPGEEDRPSL